MVVENLINLKKLGILINYSAPTAFLSQCPRTQLSLNLSLEKNENNFSTISPGREFEVI